MGKQYKRHWKCGYWQYNRLIRQALNITGTDGSWLNGMLKLASYESGDPGKLGTGDPNLINNIPVGNEYATGLMQMLPSTFREFQFKNLNDIKIQYTILQQL